MKKTSSTGGRPRGRPREFDREAALARALEVFWRYGYEGASIADLTRAMGITAPSLYTAFHSKEALYREALARYQTEVGASTVRFLEEPKIRTALASVLRESAKQFTAPAHPAGCMVSTAVLSCAEENQPVAEHVAHLRKKALGLFQARFERAIAEGELPETMDAAELARFYGAIIQGMSVQARDGATEQELLGIVELALDRLQQ
ncbi:TetR/AcrR family transcriptional regulator [Stigmatella aurantiaca]|uniref:Transcriptional regulator, TetR family n=1 Tax=Stigmatella aurantiaca (strain DW4/3-1) TaxID=378806 RepID=Q08XX4_STIAD|nr:TetR/AcrR family transcriptional regulator [Stigmatella aurantiaca]ADO75518.1 Transcriptional regulator, TetR family [Stigmatella aurantiaca DW4/3-1]EAU65336.1 transcriptional regulator, TetR family [Stigmatella aurantiaca DW4/3-1]